MTHSVQQRLFEDSDLITELDSRLWHGSFNGRESTLQQLSPYVGKMKSGMANILIQLYSKAGDVVLDPFSGSGVVPFEAALLNREAWSNDLSPYAYTLTRGKMEAPADKEDVVLRATRLADMVDEFVLAEDLQDVPQWILDFYHPDTLKEILIAFRILKSQNDFFLTSCLLGILHHVRPGFLSFPASHLVPYLRKSKYPPEQFPEMYQYRDLRSRLLAKVIRAYRRHQLPSGWEAKEYRVWQENAMNLPAKDASVDTVISSPPYFGALDYARDNRLRLWFLGCEDWKELDASLTAKKGIYIDQMSSCLREMHRILKPNAYCVLVLGDVDRNGTTHRTAEILAEVAQEATNGGFVTETIYDDRIPDIRRSRRRTSTTKFERILVMRRRSE
jgi:hypothetical protein